MAEIISPVWKVHFVIYVNSVEKKCKCVCGYPGKRPSHGGTGYVQSQNWGNISAECEFQKARGFFLQKAFDLLGNPAREFVPS